MNTDVRACVHAMLTRRHDDRRRLTVRQGRAGVRGAGGVLTTLTCSRPTAEIERGQWRRGGCSICTLAHLFDRPRAAGCEGQGCEGRALATVPLAAVRKRKGTRGRQSRACESAGARQAGGFATATRLDKRARAQPGALDRDEGVLARARLGEGDDGTGGDGAHGWGYVVNVA